MIGRKITCKVIKNFDFLVFSHSPIKLQKKMKGLKNKEIKVYMVIVPICEPNTCPITLEIGK